MKKAHMTSGQIKKLAQKMCTGFGWNDPDHFKTVMYYLSLVNDYTGKKSKDLKKSKAKVLDNYEWELFSDED